MRRGREAIGGKGDLRERTKASAASGTSPALSQRRSRSQPCDADAVDALAGSDVIGKRLAVDDDLAGGG